MSIVITASDMPIYPPQDFARLLMPSCRLMALDVGTKTVGLATAIWGEDLVIPLRTLNRIKFTRDAIALAQLINEYDIAALVIGWPLLPDGRVGKRCQSVRDFALELDKFLMVSSRQIPMTFHDERFSTASADEMIYDPVNNLGTKRDQIVDALAAQNILQNFIEEQGAV
jgi:putative holliday junction resolvase